MGDLFRAEQRGLAMGIWNLGPLVGKCCCYISDLSDLSHPLAPPRTPLANSI